MAEMPLEYGYVPDPGKKRGESPDLKFATELLPLLQEAQTGDVDLRPHCTNTSQGGLPSCVGNATADSVEIISSIQGHPKVQLSRMFVWTLARNLMDLNGDGKSDVKVKSGTHIRLAFQVINKFGICLEEYWPYDPSKWDVLPSLKAMLKATSRKIKGYYRIDGVGEHRIDQILKALWGQHPVVFGTQIDKAFGSHKGTSTLRAPKAPYVGGHAMVVVGYDRQKGFIIKNSWGTKWGDGGYAYVGEDFLRTSKTKDLWVPTMGHNFKI